jgi:hypothetical protein
LNWILGQKKYVCGKLMKFDKSFINNDILMSLS